MKIRVQWPHVEYTAEYSIRDEDARAALDYAVRHNPAFWETVRDVAGNYQHELMKKWAGEHHNINNKES